MKKSKILSLILTFAMLASMLTLPAMAEGAAPIAAGHWSDAAMGRWAEAGVFKGDQHGNYMAAKEMTRAEFAQVLVNLMGYTAVAENTYVDIPADAWYADAMLKLAAAGVMQGTGHNEVGAIASPMASISREQCAVLLCRALSLKPSAAAKIDFPDAASVSDWAKDAVAALAERGMLNGTGDGNISPALTIDRGSVAQMVSNMVSEYVTKDGAVITGEQKGIVIVAAKEVSFRNAKLPENVVVAPKAEKTAVTLTDNTTAVDVVVSAQGATVTVGKTATVDNVTLDAVKAAIAVNGVVTAVTVKEGADNSGVTVNAGGKVTTVTISAAGTTVDGAKNTIGTVTVEITASGVKITASGAKVENKTDEVIGTTTPSITGQTSGSATSGGGATSSGGGASGSGSSAPKSVYAVSGDVKVYRFHNAYTIDKDVKLYAKVNDVTHTINDAAKTSEIESGETVTLSVSEGEIEQIKVNGETITGVTFTMPAEVVKVEVILKPMPSRGVITEVKQASAAGGVFSALQLQVMDAEGNKEIITVSRDSNQANTHDPEDERLTSEDYYVGDIIAYTFDEEDVAVVTICAPVIKDSSLHYSKETGTLICKSGTFSVAEDCMLYTSGYGVEYHKWRIPEAEWTVYTLSEIAEIEDTDHDGNVSVALNDAGDQVIAVYINMKNDSV